MLAPPDEQDERTKEVLRSTRFDPDGPDLNIFTTFARHPRLLRRWSQFGGVLLTGTLDPRDREILVLRTAWNCQAEYEWGQHAFIGAQVGLTEAEVEACSLPMAEGGWSEHDQAAPGRRWPSATTSSSSSRSAWWWASTTWRPSP